MTKPYYQDELVTLYHGDCLELAAEWTFPGDVLVTDPPYGVSYVSGWVKGKNEKPIAGDNNSDVRDAVLRAWGTKPALVFGRWDIARPLMTRHRLIWSKELGPGMGDLSMPWGHGEEEIYVLGQGFTGPRESNVIRAKGYGAQAAARPNHPTPKPVALMEHLIGKAPVGVIADPFAGSGATLVAARNLGRRSLGVELEERYCEMIAKRLQQQAFDFGEWEA